MSNTPKTPADAGPDLQRSVRPVYYVHNGPNGDRFIVEPEEADEVCEHCVAMYDQAALDAAVAAEREQWRRAAIAGHLYEGACPDHVTGPNSRDPLCPLCALLGA